MSSIFSFEPFEGGEKNLLLALQQKPETDENILLEKLLSVFDLWYTGKVDAQELDTVSHNFIIYIKYYFIPNNKCINKKLFCSYIPVSLTFWIILMD